MKNNTIRLFSLLLTLVMLLGTVPFAGAVCAEGCLDETSDQLCDTCGDPVTSESTEEPADPTACKHEETITTIIPSNDGMHILETTCTAANCGLIVKTDVKICSDVDGDDECDICHAEIPDNADLCEHPETNTVFNPSAEGKHVVQAVCTNPDCSAILAQTEENCADGDANGLCDKCLQKMPVSSKYSISCPQNGTECSSDSITMTFTLEGGETDDVTWSFSASGSSDPELSTYSASGREVSVVVSTNNGQGLAKIAVTVNVDGEQITKNAYVSFCDRVSATVYVKDGMKSFRFNQTKVFKQATGFSGDRVDNCSLYSYMTDGCATRITLHESSRANEQVGNITCKTSGNFYQYDPKDYNDYNITDLQYIYFNIMGEGTFKLNFELYEMVGNRGLATTSGTITIIVGQAGSGDPDIIFRTDGSPITFGNDVFTTYWNDHAASKSERLSYIKFSVDNRNYGALYLDKTQRWVSSCR